MVLGCPFPCDPAAHYPPLPPPTVNSGLCRNLALVTLVAELDGILFEAIEANLSMRRQGSAPAAFIPRDLVVQIEHVSHGGLRLTCCPAPPCVRALLFASVATIHSSSLFSVCT